jgi:fructoselysine-6-P-deglycase FrlB-like protein
MGRAFSEELDRMEHTLAWSASVRLPILGTHVHTPCLRVVIGSGGSFTVATALAALECGAGHTAALAMTPLQYVQRADTLPRHAAMLISAEGKNRDILHAAQKAFALAEGTEALTFSRDSPLSRLAANAPSARVYCFDAPWGRDGYLATNSLLASVVLGLRLRGLGIAAGPLAAFLGLYRITDRLNALAADVASTRRLLALHGSNGLVAAVDLESKLAEAAFSFTQLADLRQFAHGRHIQLGRTEAPVPVIAFISQHEDRLWKHTRDEIPGHVTVVACPLPQDPATATIAGLLIVMALVEKIAVVLNQDPGQPAVPDFARRIHALDSSTLSPAPMGQSANPKLATLEASMGREEALQAGLQFLDRLKHARFRALVLDFDGTLCETTRRDHGLDERLAPVVVRLLEAGLTVAFASGRGNSLHDDLRRRLPPATWPRCLLGSYSGSFVIPLTESWPGAAADSPLLALQRQLEELGVRQEHGFTINARVAQLMIRSDNGDGVDILFQLCSTLVGELAGWRVFRSAHSVDILTPAAAKTSVVAHLSRHLGVNPLTEVCRIGDRGEQFGNDSELLSEGLSLSVDGVSADPQSCWFFGPPQWGSVERAAHYLGSVLVTDGAAHFDERVLTLWKQQLA